MVFEKSKFIWINDTDDVDVYAEFYTKLQIAGAPAICRISVDGDYTLFVNGQYAASNQYGDYEHYKSYDEIDISKFVHEGDNDFCVLCWHFGADSSRYKKYAPGVIFEVECDGKITLTSDKDVLARKSPAYVSGLKRWISSQLGFSFRYDASSDDAWLTGGGSGFERAVEVRKSCHFVKRPAKKLILRDAVWASKIYEDEKSTIYDLGREVVGLFTIECNGTGEINVAWGECLENGHVKRTPDWHDFSLDYICNDGGKYTNYMLRLACRYLEVTKSGKISVEKIGIVPQGNSLMPKSYDFLDGIDREIYKICLNTLDLCMMEHYVDCPWREQCLYAFDSRNQMLCGYYAFDGGNFEYARANLILLAKSQRADGLLAICSPCGINLAIPSFSLHFINAVREYYEHAGDASLFPTLKGTIKGILDAFLAREKNGLVNRFDADGYWNFYDWSPYIDGEIGRKQASGSDLMLSSLIILTLKSYKALCDAHGYAFEYEDTLCRIARATKEQFFDTSTGFFRFSEAVSEPLELPNSLAILAGLATPDEAKKICDALSKRELTPCSLSMKCFKYDAMLLVDREKYAPIILDDIRKTYEKMISVGTVWETEKGASDFNNAGSLCHGWSSIPIFYYHKLS